MNSNHPKSNPNEEELIFAEESKEEKKEEAVESWKVLIVDDEPDIHTVTKMALMNVTFENKAIKFLSAYSSEEAKKVIRENPDTALILLDVVMEERDSGLKFVKFLREELDEKMIRVILRTGQPGLAPQARVIIDYDINDYKEKSELTRDRFFSSVIVALRSFRLLEQLNCSRKIIWEQAEAAKRFVPYSFLDILKKESILDLHLGDYLEKEIVILFLDIRSFTKLSANLSPVETYEFVNEFISYLQPRIIENEGFIDKYIGDAIMALFQSPPDKAIKAALGMLLSLEDFNKVRKERSLEPIRVGIGINIGIVALGTVGFHDHMDITVVSGVVNTAERLEKMNKVFSTSLLISASVQKAIVNKEDFSCRWVGKMFVGGSGSKYGSDVYEVFDSSHSDILRLKPEKIEFFESAVGKYYEGAFSECLEMMEKVYQEDNQDGVANHYIKLCREELAAKE